MGVVYSMAIGTIKKASSSSTQKVSLKNLKQYLQSLKHEKSVKILCLDGCISCDIYVDGKIDKGLKGSFDKFLNSEVQIYRYDYQAGMQEQEKEAFFNSEGVEEEVCFSYKVGKQGIGEQVFVEYDEKIYDFSLDSPFAEVYGSLSKAQNAKEELIGLLR